MVSINPVSSKPEVLNRRFVKQFDLISLNNLTAQKLPTLKYQKIARVVLGRNYELSIAFVKSAQSRQLNRRFKKKNRPANVLAFPLAKNSGEILIDLAEVKKDSRRLGYNYHQNLVYLFIHALLHLKGYVHGSTMDSEEKRVMETLNLKLPLNNESSYRYRPGYRHGLGASGRLRIQKRK